jgi:hypothetical protein
VTEPDPIGALAAQLDVLRGQLGQLRTRFSDDYGQVMMLRLEIKKLTEKIDAAMARRQADDPSAPFWLRLDDQEHAARMTELQDWVERFARAQYPGYLAKLPECWANHPEAIWELSNVMTEWTRIYGDPDSRPLADALMFHDRWLPGALSRLSQVIHCDATGCRALRSSRWARSPPPPYT